MADDKPNDDAEGTLRSQVRRAISQCPKCAGLSPEQRDERLVKVLREIQANRARDLEPLPPAAWTQTATPTERKR